MELAGLILELWLLEILVVKFEYSSIFEATDSIWTWNEIRNDLLLRVQTVPTGADDPAVVFLYEIYLNVTYDVSGPGIQLSSPQHATNISTSNVTFEYTVSDELSGIENCSLLIEGNVNTTNTSVLELVSQYFNQSFPEGIYDWKIECYDNSSSYNYNFSLERSFTIDLNPPTIWLESPMDGVTESSGNNITFLYNLSDISQIINCSLMINNTINDTEWVVTKDTSQTFISELSNGVYEWGINCTDALGVSNVSETRALIVDSNIGPQVDSIVVYKNISFNINNK